jgi:hypothetical protein
MQRAYLAASAGAALPASAQRRNEVRPRSPCKPEGERHD